MNDTCLAIFVPRITWQSAELIRQHVSFIAPRQTVIVSHNPVRMLGLCGPLLAKPFDEMLGAADHGAEEELTVFLRSHQVTHLLCEHWAWAREILEFNSRTVRVPAGVYLHDDDSPAETDAGSNRAAIGGGACLMAGTRQCAERFGPVAGSSRVTVVAPAVEVPAAPASRAADQGCRFLAVMDFAPTSAPFHILLAFLSVCEQMADVSLDLVGSGPLEQDIRKFVQSNQILSRTVSVHALAPGDPVDHFFKQAGAFICHAVRDPAGTGVSLPSPLMQACAYGLPAVATRQGAIPELIADGTAGLLVNEFDYNRLVECLRELASNPGQRAAWGRAARERVLRDYPRERSIAALRCALGLQP